MQGSDASTLHRVHLCALGALLAIGLGACTREEPQYPGTATLRWNGVTRATDGGPALGIAGYKVFYGRSADALSTVVVLPSPTVRSYLVTGLSPGTWYFAVAAYTIGGRQGVRSNVVEKTIR